MSNPVKNAEIEDVLSSIRRLVSENHGGDLARESVDFNASATIQASTEPEAPRPISDRLVLSPALRIAEPAGAESHVQSPQKISELAPAELTSPVDDTPFVSSLKEDIAPLRENLPSFLQQRAAKHAEADTEVATQDVELDASAAAEDAPVATDEATSEAVQGLSFVHTREGDLHRSEPENTLPFPAPDDLSFETARGNATRVAEAEESADQAVAPELDAARPWEIEGERLSEWHSIRTAEPENSEVRNFEPDGPEDGANAGTPVASLNWEDHAAEAEVSTDVEAVSSLLTRDTLDPVADQIADRVVEEVAPAQEPIEAQQYDAVLDEEMLRDLVGEIVRQELQGPLGERITRNVRKLVRREINRALTARSFTKD